MKNFSSLVLQGLVVVGECFNPKDLTTAAGRWPFVLSGAHDNELKRLFYAQINIQNAPEKPEDLDDPRILERLRYLKRELREAINGIFQLAAVADEEEAKKKRKAVLDELSARHKPHLLGTVSEIAARYGISKSEVRRQKAAGTLDAYLDTFSAAKAATSKETTS